MATNYYEKYQQLHEEINGSYNCVKQNPSITLASEVQTIKDKISSLSINTMWDDSVGDKFTSIKESFVQNLEAVISSIESDFATADNTYINLKALLDNLQINNQTYQDLVSKEPIEENYIETVTYKDNQGEAQSYTRVDRATFAKDHQLWQGKKEDFEGMFTGITNQIESDKGKLEDINGRPFKLSAIASLPSLPTNQEIVDTFKDLTINSSSDLERYLATIGGDTVVLPEGLGNQHTYMGWQKVTNKSSTQYKLREAAGMNFDQEGFAKIGDRYVVATTTTFGNVGDYIDIVQTDGNVIHAVIGDIKSQDYVAWDHNPANKWGHNDGHCVVEFVVDCNSWYNSSWTGGAHENPGNPSCHPEWNCNIKEIVNKGNYFDLEEKIKNNQVAV